MNPIAIHCRLIGAPLSVLCIDQKESCCWGNLYGLFFSSLFNFPNNLRHHYYLASLSNVEVL